MEQPKKPGARDIGDLKARLGLNRGPAPGGPPPGAPARAPMPGGSPAAPPFGGAPPGAQPYPSPPGAYGGAGMGAAAAPAAQMPAHDPYAAMRPPPGRQFDLRPVDDGIPTANMRRGGFTGMIVIGLIFATVGGVLGVGFGIGMGGRRRFNQTNQAAKKIKAELDEMHKTVSQIGQSVAMSQQRTKDRNAYDPKLIEDLEKVKLDPRPDTSRLFKVDYYAMSDVAVDSLMTYYYDSIALYGEVERHVKKTKTDKASLEAFSSKQAEKHDVKYGMVFAGGGKLLMSNLVELGQPVCKGGGTDCQMDQLEGFEIRAAAGATWVQRAVGSKPDGKLVFPLDRTLLLESAMAGSPDQARMEQYRGRYASIQALLLRIAQTKKQLGDAVDTAAKREDLFSL